ncbi:Uncharacterised protein [Actinomyces bovis]|uniref:DUF6318 domain-containing protein n=1 Tax=Actinomyces bovis TaxID=1658 RepID=A0ABY1VR13_9ACTO|nr:Uncharacterised protein [Actinomyces bovis]VEG53270.1 Uncharacterised protein [Actinomyces israelii]
MSPEAQASKDKALSTPEPRKLDRMDENSVDGANQTAKYIMLLYTYTYTTGNTQPWLAISEEGCVFCQKVADNSKNLHDNGGWADHWNFEVYTLSYIAPAPGYEYSGVDVELTNPGTIEYDEFGNGTPTEVQEHRTLRLAMRHTDGRWKVREGEVLK